MQKVLGRLLPALIGASAMALAAPASASTIPIGGTFSGTGSASGSPPVFSESFNGTGLDGTFGAFTAFEQATVDVSNPSDIVLSGGTFKWTFASGFISGTFSGNGPASAVTINFLITAGLLPGDSGSATGTGSYDNVTSQVTGSYTGNIFAPDNIPVGLAPLATPLPAALPLFAGGAGFLSLFARRRKKKAAA